MSRYEQKVKVSEQYECHRSAHYRLLILEIEIIY
jgi:hypothetical protein